MRRLRRGGPAEEAPAEEVPAEEVPSAEADGDDSTGRSGGNSGRGEARNGQGQRRSRQPDDRDRGSGGSPGGSLDGGDIDLDYVAAGPFTYDHATGLGTHPQFGYDNRTISKSNGVVESLEAGDFECGDYVTFFTEIMVDSGARPAARSSWTTRSAPRRPASPDSASTTSSASTSTRRMTGTRTSRDDVVTLSNEGFESAGYDQVTGTVEIEGLARRRRRDPPADRRAHLRAR